MITFVTPKLDDDYNDATLKVALDLFVPTSGEFKLSLRDISNEYELVSSSSKLFESETKKLALSLSVSKPKKWNAETPYLYQLEVSVPSMARIRIRSIRTLVLVP